VARFVEGCDRGQSTLFPAVLDDYIGDDNAVRAIDVFARGLISPSSASTALSPSRRDGRPTIRQRS
jgi:hypothetical protein